MTHNDAAVCVCFYLTVDGNALGEFTSCDGLACEVVIEQREEGGNNGWVWQLPTRIKYPNIKLTRAVTEDTAKITQWFSQLAFGVQAKTATIQARRLDKTVIAQWNLTGVVPVRWTGPQLSADTAKVATETVEFAHHGFVDTGSGG